MISNIGTSELCHNMVRQACPWAKMQPSSPFVADNYINNWDIDIFMFVSMWAVVVFLVRCHQFMARVDGRPVYESCQAAAMASVGASSDKWIKLVELTDNAEQKCAPQQYLSSVSN